MYLLGSTAQDQWTVPASSPRASPREVDSQMYYQQLCSDVQLSEANINTAASPIAPLEASSLLARTPLPGKQHRCQFIADISQGHYQNPKPRRMIPTNVPSCNLVQIDY